MLVTNTDRIQNELAQSGCGIVLMKIGSKMSFLTLSAVGTRGRRGWAGLCLVGPFDGDANGSISLICFAHGLGAWLMFPLVTALQLLRP